MDILPAYAAEIGEKKDPCVETPDTEYKFCIVLTPEQRPQLATPSYRLKKEKHEAKKLESSSSTPSNDYFSGSIHRLLLGLLVIWEPCPPLPYYCSSREEIQERQAHHI